MTIEQAEACVAAGIPLWYEWDQAHCQFKTRPALVRAVDVANNRLLIEHWEELWVLFDPCRISVVGYAHATVQNPADERSV